jgi:aminopeptidase N
VREGYDPGPAQAGRRALANLALAMLPATPCATADAVWPGRAYQRVKDAGNMTDRLGALQALVARTPSWPTLALARFHARFKGDALAIDKWFALQAWHPRAWAAPAACFARVKQLLQHPDFSLRNPNRARSLLLQLCVYNPAAFHRPTPPATCSGPSAAGAGRAQPAAGRPPGARHGPLGHLAEPYRSAAREAIARVAAKPRPQPRRARDRDHARPGDLACMKRISLTQYLVEQQREHGRIPASCAC